VERIPAAGMTCSFPAQGTTQASFLASRNRSSRPTPGESATEFERRLDCPARPVLPALLHNRAEQSRQTDAPRPKACCNILGQNNTMVTWSTAHRNRTSSLLRRAHLEY